MWLELAFNDTNIWKGYLHLDDNIFVLFSIYFAVAPDAIHNHVKTYREVKNNMHYVAPEYASK